MNALSTLVSAITGDRPSTLSVSQPSPISAADLEPIGELHGRRWFYSKRYNAELCEQGRRYNLVEILPALPLVRLDDGWIAYDMHAPGSYERLAATAARRERPRPAHRPVDAIATAWLADRIPERVVPLPRTKPLIKDAEDPARGPEAILARLRSHGADVRLAADMEHLVVTARLGRPTAGVVELVNLAQRLLVAHLRGEPLRCEVERHKKPVPAITLLVGGAAACEECLYRLEPEQPVTGAA